MAAILKLPMELKIEMCQNLGNNKDLKSLACVGLFYLAATDLIWGGISTVQKCQILMWACAVGSTRAARRVLEEGISANLIFQLGHYITMTALKPESYLDLAHFWSSTTFLSNESSSHTTSTQDTASDVGAYWTPLHLAVKHGHHDIIDLLLECGASIEAPAKYSCCCTRPISSDFSRFQMYTPLHTALCTRQENIANLLISRGASRYIDHALHTPYRTLDPNRNRFTALHDCAIHGLLDTARFLVEQGNDSVIDKIDEFGYSPVMYAYWFGHDNIFDLLLAHGASVRATTSNSLPDHHRNASWKEFKPKFPSLLHQACHDLRWEAVTKLVDHGCDVFERDRNGEHPLQLCIRRFKYEVWTDPNYDLDEKQEELKNMTDIIELYRMHVHTDKEGLSKCMKIALELAILPVVSLLLDGGMDSSTMLEVHESRRLGELEDTDTNIDPVSCHYLDTRWLRKTDTQPFAATSGVTAASKSFVTRKITTILSKKLSSSKTTGKSNYDAARNSSVTTYLSHLREAIKPRLTIDIFYICVDNGQSIILEELLEVFDLAATEYSEQELWQLYHAITNENYWEGNVWRPINNLEYLFRLDRDHYLLQHPQAFERLCRCFETTTERGELAILDYLDRGGQHSRTNWLRLAERLGDLGADPNRLISEDDKHTSAHWMWCSNGHNLAMLRLFIERGAHPFRTTEGENLGLDFPFRDCLESDTEHKFQFFRELCRLTLDNNTDDGDLFDILDLACTQGRLKCISEVRSWVGNRVDAMIRDKAAYFLQKLLVSLSSLGEWYYRWNHVREMDDAIDTMRLILQVGGQGILTSSWRMKIGSQDDTALKFLRRLLTDPPLPEPYYHQWTDLHDCDHLGLHRCKVFWCLNQRIKFGSGSSEKSVTILGGSIKWPSKWEARYVSSKKADEVRGTFGQLRICSCEESVL
ncbi:hypothetical protein PG988_001316 [Apiospora saccharicola]